MEFDWSQHDASSPASQQQIEECMEDPFGLRLIPDTARFAEQNRFFCLGQDAGGKHWTIAHATTGKVMRIICAREMTAGEKAFYERKLRENL